MAQFVYLARLNNGERKEGEISADSYKNAMELLVLKNYSVVKLNEKDTSFDFINPFLDRFNLAIEKLKNKVSLSVLVFFTRQLSTMFSAGLTIEKAIHFLALEEKNKKFKTMLIGIENTIKKGLSLSDSLLRHPGVFSNIYISLVKAGEVSGKLYETLESRGVGGKLLLKFK